MVSKDWWTLVHCTYALCKHFYSGWNRGFLDKETLLKHSWSVKGRKKESLWQLSRPASLWPASSSFVRVFFSDWSRNVVVDTAPCSGDFCQHGQISARSSFPQRRAVPSSTRFRRDREHVTRELIIEKSVRYDGSRWDFEYYVRRWSLLFPLSLSLSLSFKVKEYAMDRYLREISQDVRFRNFEIFHSRFKETPIDPSTNHASRFDLDKNRNSRSQFMRRIYTVLASPGGERKPWLLVELKSSSFRKRCQNGGRWSVASSDGSLIRHSRLNPVNAGNRRQLTL